MRRAVRVGTCGALDEALGLGELLCAEAALPEDGTSVALGANGPIEPDPALLERLRLRAEAVTVASTDLFYEPDTSARERGSSAAPARWRWRPRRSSPWAPGSAWRWDVCWW